MHYPNNKNEGEDDHEVKMQKLTRAFMKQFYGVYKYVSFIIAVTLLRMILLFYTDRYEYTKYVCACALVSIIVSLGFIVYGNHEMTYSIYRHGQYFIYIFLGLEGTEIIFNLYYVYEKNEQYGIDEFLFLIVATHIVSGILNKMNFTEMEETKKETYDLSLVDLTKKLSN